MTSFVSKIKWSSEHLKDQVNILSTDDIVNCNPFEVTDSDADEANTKTSIIAESDDEDFIDIE